jgi:acyl-coenzyme A thioesterase PaaI-like protein
MTLIPPTSSVLTTEFKINLLNPADGDLLIAQGSVIKPGKMLTVAFSSVYIVKDGQKKLCSTCMLSIMNMAGKTDNTGMKSN